MLTISPASVIASKVFALVAEHLNERQRRLLLGAFALVAGRGGITQVAGITGVARRTVRLGRQELTGRRPSPPNGQVRHAGAGRRRLRDEDSELVADLDRLIEPTTRGEPDSPLRWTCKSAQQLARGRREMGHRVSARTVTRLLHEMGYSLQANAKLNEGKQHPDRDAQFAYLNEQVRQHQAEGAPVLSVDTKKKELVGEFKNGGREWQPRGRPEAVNVHDFLSQGVGKAIPYGIYDVSRNSGWVSVGIDHDTASFAVESLRRWWLGEGRFTVILARALSSAFCRRVAGAVSVCCMPVAGPLPVSSAELETGGRWRAWSGGADSNRRSPGPKPGALPNCATARAFEFDWTACVPGPASLRLLVRAADMPRLV